MPSRGWIPARHSGGRQAVAHLGNTPGSSDQSASDAANWGSVATADNDPNHTLLDVDEELTPALRTLAHSGLEADEFFLALRGCSYQHQHAFRSLFHPGLQVDPVGPHVHVSPR